MKWLMIPGASMMIFQAWTSGAVNGLTILGAILLSAGAIAWIGKLTNADND